MRRRRISRLPLPQKGRSAGPTVGARSTNSRFRPDPIGVLPLARTGVWQAGMLRVIRDAWLRLRLLGPREQFALPARLLPVAARFVA